MLTQSKIKMAHNFSSDMCQSGKIVLIRSVCHVTTLQKVDAKSSEFDVTIK